MLIRNLEEHIACFNYEKGKDHLIELLKTEDDLQGEILLNNHTLYYIINGSVRFTYASYTNVLINNGQLIFIPIGSIVEYFISAGSECLVFRLNDEIKLCDCSHVGTLISQADEKRKPESPKNPFIIDTNRAITSYMKGMACLVEQKLLCRSFFEIKIRELLYLLGAFYNKKELASFFRVCRHSDATFSSGVIRNYRQCDSVAELAEALHYTVSGFEKRFKKTFGKSPAKWFREQKAKQIYKDVCQGELNFKEIADKYDFSSTSTFNDFYKQTFGETPGRAREKANIRRV